MSEGPPAAKPGDKPPQTGATRRERLAGIRGVGDWTQSMNRYHLVLLLAAVALATLAVVPVAIAADDDGDDETDAPGELLAGGVAAQEAELAAEVDERAFGQAIATAAAEGDTEALAALIDERIEADEAALDELTDRLETLDEQYADGELTRGEYRQAIAQLEVERQSIVRSSGDALAAAWSLPDDELAAHGVDLEALEALQANASELGGDEVRDHARSIAGPHVGNASPDRPSATDRILGQVLVDDPERAVERVDHWVTHTERQHDRVSDRAERFNDTQAGPPGDVDPAVFDELDAAADELGAAADALADAEAALADGDDDAALEHAQTAAEAAAAASDHTHAAMALLGHGPGAPGHGGPHGGGGPPGH